MSIQKLSDMSRIEPEGVPFTQVCNTVIHNIKNGDAFLVWCYLQSKSSNWKIIKQNIKNQYGLGDGKIKKIFSYLNRCGLIKYVQRIGSNGRFEPIDTVVLNGSLFDKNQPFIELNTGGTENRPAVDRTTGFDELLNKEIQNKEKKQNKHSCPSENDGRKSFDDFWKLYPRKQKKLRAEQIWHKNKLDGIAAYVLTSIQKRLETDWKTKDKEFIPLPDTYLSQKRWTDEVDWIIPSTVRGKEYVKNTNEIRSTVPDWGPGHPSYDEIHGRQGDHDATQGSEVSRNNARGNGVRKAESYLLSRNTVG